MKTIKNYFAPKTNDIAQTVIDEFEITKMSDEKHYVYLLTENLLRLTKTMSREDIELIDSAVDWLEDLLKQKQEYELDYDRLCRLGIDQQRLNEQCITVIKRNLEDPNLYAEDRDQLENLLLDMTEQQLIFKNYIPQPEFYLKSTPKIKRNK